MDLSEIGLLCEPVTPPCVEPISPDRCDNDQENVRIQANNQQTLYKFLSNNVHPSLYPSCPISLNAVADSKELCFNNEHLLSSGLEENANSLKGHSIKSFTDRRQVYETVCSRQVHDINLLESHANSQSLLSSVQKCFDQDDKWSNNISTSEKRVLPFLDGHITGDVSGMPGHDYQMSSLLNAEESNYSYPCSSVKSKNTSKTSKHRFFDGSITSQLSQDLIETSSGEYAKYTMTFENDLMCLSTRSTSNLKRDIDQGHVSMSRAPFQGSDFPHHPKCTRGSSRPKRKRSHSRSSSTEIATIKEGRLYTNDTNFDDVLHSKSFGCKNSMQRSTEFCNLPSSSAFSSRKTKLRNITDLRELLNNSRRQNQSPNIDDMLVRSDHDQMQSVSLEISPEECLNQYYPCSEVKPRTTFSTDKEKRHHFAGPVRDDYSEADLNDRVFGVSESCSSAYILDSRPGGSTFQDTDMENYLTNQSRRHFDYHDSDELCESSRPVTSDRSRNVDNRSPLESRLLISIGQKRSHLGRNDRCVNDHEASRKVEECRRVIMSSALRSRSRSRSYSSSLKSRKSFDSGSTYGKKKQSRHLHRVHDNNTPNREDLFGDRWAYHDEYNQGCTKDERYCSSKGTNRKQDEEMEGQSLKELEEKRQCLMEACYWTGLAGAKSSTNEESWREHDSSPKKSKSRRHHSSPTSFGRKRKRRRRESERKERGHKRSKKKRHRRHHSPDGEEGGDGDHSDDCGGSCHGDESGGVHEADEGGSNNDDDGERKGDVLDEDIFTRRQEKCCSDSKNDFFASRTPTSENNYHYHRDCDDSDHDRHGEDSVNATRTTITFANNDYYGDGDNDDEDDEDADRLCIDTTVENTNGSEATGGSNSEDCSGENIEDADAENVSGDANGDIICRGGFVENSCEAISKGDNIGEDVDGETIGEDVDGENLTEVDAIASQGNGKVNYDYLGTDNKECLYNPREVPDYPQNSDSEDVLRKSIGNDCRDSGDEDLNECYGTDGGDSNSHCVNSNLDGVNEHIETRECQENFKTSKDCFPCNDTDDNDDADRQCYDDVGNVSNTQICCGGDDDDDNNRLIETRYSAESIEKAVSRKSPSEEDICHISMTDSSIMEGNNFTHTDLFNSRKTIKSFFGDEGCRHQKDDSCLGEADNATDIGIGDRSCEENAPESDCCEKKSEELSSDLTFESEEILTESRDAEENSRSCRNGDDCYNDVDHNNKGDDHCCDEENDISCDEKDSENLKELNENVLTHVSHFNNRTPSYDSAEDVGADLIDEDREDERYSLCSDGFNDDNIKNNHDDKGDIRHENFDQSCTPVYDEDDTDEKDLYCQLLSRHSKTGDKYDGELSDELNGGSYTPTANTDHIPGLSPIERTSPAQGAYTPTSKPPSLLGDDSPISPISSPCSPPPPASMGFSDLTQVLIQTLGNHALLGNATNNTNSPAAGINSFNSLLGGGGDVLQQLFTRFQSIYQQSSMNNNLSGFSASNSLLSLPFLLQPHQKTINPTVLHYLGLQSLSALGRSAATLPGVLGDISHVGTVEGPRISYSPFDVNTVSPRSEDAISFSPPSLPAGCNEAQTDGLNLSDQKSCDGGSSKNAISGDTETRVKATDKADLQQKLVADIKEILRPVFKKGKIDKEDYKDILRKTVPKILKSHKLSYNRDRITRFTEAYIQKIIATKKYYSKKTTT